MAALPRHDGWSVERVVPLLGGAVTLGGLALGRRDPSWRAQSAFAGANLVLYGTVGWCPASLLMERAGTPPHGPPGGLTARIAGNTRPDYRSKIMELAIATTVAAPFDETVARTKAALAEQGFGVLTEIDMSATLKAKIGAEIEDYVILGACNPPLAHRAVEVDRQIGLLLPCNVVVRASGEDTVVVEAMNPQVMVEVTDDPGLVPVAEDATARLRAAIDALGA